jgi:hypothetical protein
VYYLPIKCLKAWHYIIGCKVLRARSSRAPKLAAKLGIVYQALHRLGQRPNIAGWN